MKYVLYPYVRHGAFQMPEISVVDPDPVGCGSFCPSLIQIGIIVSDFCKFILGGPSINYIPYLLISLLCFRHSLGTGKFVNDLA
jgi:hypothetical protein